MKFIIENPNLNYLTYSTDQLINFSILFSGIGMAICFGLYHFVKERKKLSWGITFINSFITSLFSVYYIYMKKTEIINYFYTGVGAISLLTSVNDYSVLCCIWFAVMNMYDLLFGILFYYKYLGVFTAFIHHPFYVWVMISSITGNIGFIKIDPFSTGLLFFLVEEIPTFIMSLGTFFPEFKTHLGYGISFFVFRVCYHTYLVYLLYLFKDQLELAHIIFPLMPLVMHIVWFKEWLDKYGQKAITF
jgi:hypothetical protein